MILRISVLLAVIILGTLPLAASAATLTSARTVVVSEPVSENLYVAGSDVTLAAPLGGDLVASGATLSVSSTIAGDALLAGGRVDVRKAVAGDVRAVGGEVLVDATIGGDLMAIAGTITASTTATDMHLLGATVRVSGSGGKVMVYGADVYLSGLLQGDVTVTASDKVFLAEGTQITGSLNYDAPQQVVVPASAVITGGVIYTGSSAFLPTNEEAKRFAIAGAGVLLITRILAVVIAAGVVVGLFPVLAHMVVGHTIRRTPRRFVLLALLGFAAIVATPILILFLLVSFVGIALAVLLVALYVLMLLLAYLYAGLVSGAALSHALFKKDRITWRTAVLGTLALCLVGSVPVIGFIVVSVLTSASLGALMAVVYKASFGNSEETSVFLSSDDSTH